MPGIHVLAQFTCVKTWMAGTKPGHDEYVVVAAATDRRQRYPGTFKSSGTAASYFELCSTSDVLTLRTCGAAVRCVTNF